MTDPITTPAQMREASIYYIDCEFDGHSGPLLSLALVRDDGYSTHIRVNIDANDPWVQANVMPIMDNHGADIALTVDPGCVGQAIRDFIGPSEHPLIIADSPVDIGRFCAAISTASDGQWSSVDYPKISFAVHNVVCYPTKLAGAVQHNAWWDAMALRDTLCRALPVAEPVSDRDAIRPHLIAERMRWWSPEYPGQTPPTLAVWWRDEPEDGLSGFDTRQDRDAFLRGEPGPFIRRVTGNEFPQLPCADNRADLSDALLREAVAALGGVMTACDQGRMVAKTGVGGMTIEANIRGSVYMGVPAWPIEEARATLAKLREHLDGRADEGGVPNGI